MTDLERELADLGDHLDVPDAPMLAARVTAHLRAPRPSRRPRRLVLALAALALAVVGGLTPAVADWLGVRGVEVRQEDAPVPAPAGRSLDLGRATTLAEAADLAGFRPLVPSALGPPDGVWVGTRQAVAMVHLVWDEPRTLLTQFRGDLADELLLTKFAGAGVTVERQAVGDDPGVWIEGTHEVAMRTPDDVYMIERLRLSDSALLWERGPLTFRLETVRGRAEAVRLAGTLRPAAV